LNMDFCNTKPETNHHSKHTVCLH